METLLKDEFGINKKQKIRICIGVAVFLVVALLSCYSLYFSTKQVIVDQMTSNIINISQLNADSVSRSITNREILLETISNRLMRRGVTEKSVILQELEDYRVAYDFSNMGLLDENLVLYTTDGKEIDASSLPFIQEACSDDFYLSESYQPLTGGEYMVNMFTYPVYLEDGTRYNLAASYYSINLTDRMNITSLEGDGHTFLLDQEGKVVIYPRHYDNEEYNQLMEYVNDHPMIIPMDGGESSFTYNGDTYYAHFEKMEYNDWCLMTCAREKDIYSGLGIITRNSHLAIGLLWVMIVGGVVSAFGNASRVSKERQKFAFYDSLLNIGNANALSVVFEKLSPQELSEMYLVVFDIDKFKEFNYIYGEEGGDRLLKYIVQVFQETFPDVYLFRYYSDFFVTLDRCKDQEAYEEKLKKLQDRFTRDIEGGLIQPFDISAGVKKIEVGESLQRLISDALIARGTVKGNHIRHHAFYNDEIRLTRVRYMEMETDFPAAIQNSEFHVYYQPKYNMVTGEIIGAEALARWVRPDGTVVGPVEFVPCFEKSRQIIMLDEAILRGVCRQMKRMQFEGMEVKPVSVNLSRVHLRTPDILTKISSIIQEFGVDPTKLSFEITESALYEDSIPLKTIVDYIHSMGCQVEMDDYGVGVSGPNALASNSFDTVKLDKTFVDGLGNERVEDVIRSTANLAKKWGMSLLAEGVENQTQARQLVGLGCVLCQGFYYSRPVPEEEYRRLLKEAPKPARSCMEVSNNARYFSRSICELLDGNQLPTYIVDPERFIVRYCNQAMCKALGKDPTGGLCYQKMRGRDKPCEECSAMRLYRDRDNSSKEYFSPLGMWVRLHTSSVRWQGREYIQITCVDISKQKKLEEELRQRSME